MSKSEYKISKKQHAKDSEVFGAIMAGARSRKKRLTPGLPGVETPSSMCAVGAGNQGRKVTRWSDVITKSYQYHNGLDASSTLRHQTVPAIRFAMANGVSEDYACGVNDGFEGRAASPQFFPDVDRNCLDYERGWHVGQAVREESGW